MIEPNVARHTQIIQFVSGHKKTILNVIRIDEGEMLTLTTESGKEFIIPKDKVEWVERYTGERTQQKKKRTKRSVKSTWYGY